MELLITPFQRRRHFKYHQHTNSLILQESASSGWELCRLFAWQRSFPVLPSPHPPPCMWYDPSRQHDIMRTNSSISFFLASNHFHLRVGATICCCSQKMPQFTKHCKVSKVRFENIPQFHSVINHSDYIKYGGCFSIRKQFSPLTYYMFDAKSEETGS